MIRNRRIEANKLRVSIATISFVLTSTLNASIIISRIVLLSKTNTALKAIMKLSDLTLKIISTIDLSF